MRHCDRSLRDELGRLITWALMGMVFSKCSWKWWHKWACCSEWWRNREKNREQNKTQREIKIDKEIKREKSTTDLATGRWYSVSHPSFSRSMGGSVVRCVLDIMSIFLEDLIKRFQLLLLQTTPVGLFFTHPNKKGERERHKERWLKVWKTQKKYKHQVK